MKNNKAKQKIIIDYMGLVLIRLLYLIHGISNFFPNQMLAISLNFNGGLSHKLNFVASAMLRHIVTSSHSSNLQMRPSRNL